MDVLISTIKPQSEELPTITTLDLSDLMSGEERTAAIIERDADAALNLETQAEDVILSEYYRMRFREPTWIREASELLFP